MLYQSTRSKTDSFTAHRALHEERTLDGGLFAPFRMPVCDQAFLAGLKNKTFGENVASIINLFFGAELTGWDVDCIVGKNAVDITSMSNRVVLARTWHNPGNHFSYMVNQLYKKLAGKTNTATAWCQIAIQIAVLFGLTGELSKLGIDRFDIASISGDFKLVTAAWYANRMGLPVGTIICSCNENNLCWDLIHRGTMDASTPVVHTQTPELDVQIPVNLEHLIFGVFGVDETLRYIAAVKEGKTYSIDALRLPDLSRGLFVSVVGQNRVEPMIKSVYRSGGVVLDPYAAVTYGGLQDYRAKTGVNRPTLLISDRSPMTAADLVLRATGLARNDLKKYL